VLWPLVESVILRRPEEGAKARVAEDGRVEEASAPLREDFPLLILHGFADSLASRGQRCPLALGRRADIYLVFLALWHRRDDLASIHEQWKLCKARATEKANPDLHRAVFPPGSAIDPERQKIPGQLQEWAWGRGRLNRKCPEPGASVDGAIRRIGEQMQMPSNAVTGVPEDPMPGSGEPS
jgi:hypothetical protein